MSLASAWEESRVATDATTGHNRRNVRTTPAPSVVATEMLHCKKTLERQCTVH
jgi:hypothetical protein